MTDHKKAPQGRSYAFYLPETMRKGNVEIITSNGTMFCYQLSTGLIFPLEAVCEKVQIPGVRYSEEDEL